MKKILLTNNLKLVNNQYDKIYTDSPYLIEEFKEAIYLDTLLDKDLHQNVENIRTKGFDINKFIVEEFFPKYKNRNMNILSIHTDFTNIYINIKKLLKLVELYPNDEITIKITRDELYNYDNSNVLDRFVNVYYWLVELYKIKNIRLECSEVKNYDLSLGHLPINDWFLRLVDLDKKVLIFNFFKKINLIKKNKKKIYLFKKSNFISEIEPYLYDLGFNLINMPKIDFNYDNNNNFIKTEKLKKILDKFFENNLFNNIFKLALYEIYKKSVELYSQKEFYTEKYISRLDKSIKTILTSTINGFDSYIFAKQLQLNGFKIINVMHGFSTSFRRKKDLDFYECQAPDMTLCFNSSEKSMYQELVPKALLYPISVVQEAKKKRLKSVKRFYVNKLLNINDDKNIFYPSSLYPLNNVTSYGWRQSDKLNFKFEKKMISLLSGVNKRVIYKHYPMRGFIDENPMIKYAKSFKNIKVINERYDFRYVSSIGDIFILGNIGSSSTVTWMLGENKPIIFLYTNKFRFINEEARMILDKIFIVTNIDEDNWVDNLAKVLNRPYDELLKIWKDKQIFRDQYDEDWLMGMNLNAGKLGSQFIHKFIQEN